MIEKLKIIIKIFLRMIPLKIKSLQILMLVSLKIEISKLFEDV
jgi:hypothetical protein